MSEPASAGGDTPATKAPKDKNCQYCGQAFTSSSLGRHLDLYIKEKNPKPPDGIHIVEEIRKLRGSITRRQPRNSLARRDTSNTPAATPRKSPGSEADDSSSAAKAPVPKDSQRTVDKYPFHQPRWEDTGVMNDLAAPGDAASDPSAHRPVPQRTVSRQAQKAQLDIRQKLADATDTARAAELALRELLSSWRAAKIHFDMNTMPFDFDPLSLDFPALTLQCLQPPPTLFSSTQHPTATSWSIDPPDQKQYEALLAYFTEEFRKWKVACQSATTAVNDDLPYPLSAKNPFQTDGSSAILKAEKAGAELEKQVSDHLQSAYTVWKSLSPQRRHELWILELARSVGRKQKEVTSLRDGQHRLKQEVANLKSQIEHLNLLQQPREFKIQPPATIPFDESFLSFTLDVGIKTHFSGTGFDLDGRHLDLNTVVSRCIDRWKSVITSARSANAGMAAQKPLDQAVTPAPSAASSGNPTTAATPPQPQQSALQQQPVPNPVQPPKPTQQKYQQQHQQKQQHQQQAHQLAPANGTNHASPQITSREPNSAVSSTGMSMDETSDQDADGDADMDDDDSFVAIPPSSIKPASQSPLEITRTRPLQQNQPQPVQQVPQIQQVQQVQHQQHNQQAHRMVSGDQRPQYILNGSMGPGAAAANQAMNGQINLSRSIPNINTNMHAMHQHNVLGAGDHHMGLAIAQADPMYLDPSS